MGVVKFLLLILFFISGGCGLGYEILWTRYLELILGNTTFSVASILSSFMLGFAIGSYYAGKKYQRTGFKAFYYYLLCELLIGIFAAISPFLLPSLNIFISFFYRVSGGNFYIFSIFKFIIITIVLAIPTTLMGATFPLIVESMSVLTSKISRWSALLYASNLLGAGSAIALSLLILLPKLTLDGTVFFFSFLNFFIFVSGFIIYRLFATPGRLEIQDLNLQVQGSISISEKIMMVLYLISGLASFSLQIVWTRYYILLAGGSIYSFGMILFGWIIGLGIGSFFSSFFLDRSRGYYLFFGIFLFLLAIIAFVEIKFISIIMSPHSFDIEFGAGFLLLFLLVILVIIGLFTSIIFFEKMKDYYFNFAILQLTIGILSLLEYVWITLTPYFYMMFYPSGENVFFKDRFPGLWNVMSKYFIHRFEYETVLKMLLIFKGIVLPTIGLGAVLPMLLRGFVQKGILPAKSASLLYIFNCLGAVLGSWITSFLLIPLFGLKSTNNILAVIFILLFFVSLQFLSKKRELTKIVFLVVALLLISGAIYYQNQTNLEALLSGVYLYSSHYKNVEQFIDSLTYKSRLFLYEGLTSIVDIRSTRNAPYNITLAVNGKVDASSYFDLETQVFSGHIGMFYKSNVENVLVIGLGSGITAGSISLYDSVKSLEIVEIEKGVVKGSSKYYRKDNYAVLDNPRVKLIIDDGRSYLSLIPKKYDLITSEPSNPWLTGASSLFTREFFLDVKKHLKDDGIFVQWFHTYHMHPELVKSLIKTFATVFPEVVLHAVYKPEFQSYSNDIFLIGSNKKLTLDYLHLQKIFSNKKIFKDLLRIGIFNPAQIFTTFYLDKKDIENILKDNTIKLNTDKNMYIEFSAVKYLGNQGLATMSHMEIENIKTIYLPRIKNYNIRELIKFDFVKRIIFAISVDNIKRAIVPMIGCYTEGNLLCGLGVFYLYLRDLNNPLAHKFLIKNLKRKLPREIFLDLLLFYNYLTGKYIVMKNILLKMNKMMIPESAFLARTAYYFKEISYPDRFFYFLKKAIARDKYNLELYYIMLEESKNFNRLKEYMKYYKIMLKIRYGYNLAFKIILKRYGWFY